MNIKHSLYWPQQANLGRIFRGSRGRKHDVILACETGELLKAHRAVLRACSPYLRRILDDTTSDVPVILEACLYDDVKLVLEFIYHGCIEVTEVKISLN